MATRLLLRSKRKLTQLAFPVFALLMIRLAFVALNDNRMLQIVQNDDREAVQNALDHGGDVNAKYYSWTMLGMAARYDRVEVMQMLLDRGANIDARNPPYQQTALMMATKFHHLKAVRLLLWRKADTTARDWRGNTALMLARQYNDPRLATALIQAGAKE